MIRPVSTVLKDIRESLEEKYVGDKYTHQQALDRLFDMIDGIANELMIAYQIEDEEAFNFIASVGDSLEESNDFPPFPSDSSKEQEIYAWEHCAHRINFAHIVMTRAAEESLA